MVVVSGGGTGGHLYPALAIADALRELRPDVRVVFVGAERGIEARILPARGEEHLLVPVHGIDRARPLGSWRAATGLVVGLVRVARLFRKLRPEVVVVTGGYAAAPAGIVAGLSGTPLVLQEQNSLPGAVTKLLTRWASRAHVAFPEAVERLPLVPPALAVTGNPVRARSELDRDAARAVFDVPGDAFLVLVVGGSQGSVALNAVMIDLAEALGAGAVTLPRQVRFLWATGPRHYGDVAPRLEAAAAPAVHAVDYLGEMPAALAAADLAVSRAGAMATAELLNQGLPAVLVPLPTAAEDHQMHNARALADAGAAVVVPQSELTAAGLAELLTELVTDPARLDSMRRAALARARPDARVQIAADVASLLSYAGSQA